MRRRTLRVLRDEVQLAVLVGGGIRHLVGGVELGELGALPRDAHAGGLVGRGRPRSGTSSAPSRRRSSRRCPRSPTAARRRSERPASGPRRTTVRGCELALKRSRARAIFMSALVGTAWTERGCWRHGRRRVRGASPALLGLGARSCIAWAVGPALAQARQERARAPVRAHASARWRRRAPRGSSPRATRAGCTARRRCAACRRPGRRRPARRAAACGRTRRRTPPGCSWRSTCGVTSTPP